MFICMEDIICHIAVAEYLNKFKVTTLLLIIIITMILFSEATSLRVQGHSNHFQIGLLEKELHS